MWYVEVERSGEPYASAGFPTKREAVAWAQLFSQLDVTYRIVRDR